MKGCFHTHTLYGPSNLGRRVSPLVQTVICNALPNDTSSEFIKPESTPKNKADILARIAKAKEYKSAEKDASSTSSNKSTETVQTSTNSSYPTDWKGRTTDGTNSPGDETFAEWILSTPRTPGTGSATEAADSLKYVLNEKNYERFDDTKNMRMEEFTLAKEERVKSMGADIITIDQSYNPGSLGSGESSAPSAQSYQPKVSTWGMFPRPSNISETYGGGKNILPGQELETKEQKVEREKSYAAALLRYKQSIGAEIDSSAEQAAQQLYNEGMELFNQGSLQAAYFKFEEACKKVPLQTKLGGLSSLQKAIILDSVGENKSAEALYKQLRNHPTQTVQKKAKQLLFGFEAMTFLNTSKLNMGVKSGDYVKYFRPITDRNKIYVASEEEIKADAELARLSTTIAVAVLIAPIALFLGLLRLDH